MVSWQKKSLVTEIFVSTFKTNSFTRFSIVFLRGLSINSYTHKCHPMVSWQKYLVTEGNFYVQSTKLCTKC